MKADLHCHTNASDGVRTRRELLELAKSEGAQAIAITDHDTMINSYSDPTDPVSVIPACELSGFDPETGRRVHILCFMPKDTSALEAHFELMKQRRLEAARQMFERVEKRFGELTWEAVCESVGPSGCVFRQNIMLALIKLGYADKYYGELYYELFAAKSGSCFVPTPYESYDRLIETAREAGGVVVLAHPSVYDTVALARELIEKSMVDGVELNHPKNRRADVKLLAALCVDKDMIITGGSDYHGLDPACEAMLGSYTTDEQNLNRIFELHERRK